MRFRTWLLLLLAISSLGGCVRRRLTVRSTPPGALVFIDGQEIGRTPVSTQFTYYGTRNFRLVKDGFETISVNQRFPTPWYQVPPLDFVSENLVPREIRDERAVNFELVPKANVSMEDVLIHGEQLRSQVRQPADRYLTQSPEVTLGPAMESSHLNARAVDSGSAISGYREDPLGRQEFDPTGRSEPIGLRQ